MMIATGITALVLAEPALVTGLTVVAEPIFSTWPGGSRPHRLAESMRPQIRSQLFRQVSCLPLPIQGLRSYWCCVFWADSRAENLAGDLVAKVTALIFVIVVVNTAWLAFGSAFSRFLSEPKIGRAANIAFAIMLVASVALALIGD